MANSKPNEPMARLEITSGVFMVTFEQAVAVAKALHNAPALEHEWKNHSWKRRTERTTPVSIQLMDDTDVALIELNSDSPAT